MTIETTDVDPATPAVAAMIAAHLLEMQEESPPESVHAIDGAALAGDDVTLIGAYVGTELAGIGALRIADGIGELKSMRTSANFLRQGIAARILSELVDVARAEGLDAVSLETGAGILFAPARALYRRHGFVECAPFGDYRLDPLSVYMTLHLTH